MSKKIGRNKLLKTLKFFFLSLGGIFFAMLILALTPAPFYWHYALGDSPSPSSEEAFVPSRIVMFGGAGMPSEGNLIRLYYTSGYAKRYHVPVLIVHPDDSVCQHEMKRYLVQSGVPESDIAFMTEGTNTRSQALELAKIPHFNEERLMVVTAPENIRRTVKSLQKVGFTNLRGMAAREATVDFDLSLKGQDLRGNERIHTVESSTMRYTFWNYLKLEVTCFREYLALAYYRIKGWI